MPGVILSKYVRKVSPAEDGRIRDDKKLGHDIPSLLIDATGNLRNIRYRDLLKSFAVTYRTSTFQNPLDEFKIIKQTLSLILKSSLQRPMVKVLEDLMRIQSATMYLEEKYRDHFIHPFQDFLLGCAILDEYLPQFRSWYSDSLSRRRHTDVETCWLLSTVFHDSLRPFQIFGDTVRMYGSIHENWAGMEPRFASLLVSIHEHVARGKDPIAWAPPKGLVHNEFASALILHAKRGDHGIQGAFFMLNEMAKVEGSWSLITPTEAMAALAIALHHHQPRRDFLNCRALPVKFEIFPVPALLLYCDAAQEWGRPLRDYTPEIFLVDLGLRSNQIACEVSFPTRQTAKDKIAEFRKLSPCLRSDILKLYYTARIHSWR